MKPMINPLVLRTTLMLGLVLNGGIAERQSFANPASNLTVSVQDQRLTLITHEASLFEIVDRLAQALGIKGYIGPDVEEKRLSLHLQNVALQQGLDHILANTNYVLTDKHLHVWSRNQTKGKAAWREGSSKPISPPERLSADVPLTHEGLKREALFSPNAEDRLAALEALSDWNAEKLMPTLAKVLEDQDPEVRAMALEILSETQGTIPVDALSEIVRKDPLPEHRLLAIGMLASRDPEKSESLLKEALQDRDPDVAELAKSILEDADFEDADF